MSRTGRRPGESGAREAILRAARASFAERGFDRTTIRGVARVAGVDPALVHHYFGTKGDLFQAAIELPFDVAQARAIVLSGDPRSIGERIVRLFLSVWGVPESRGVFLGLLRTAVSHPEAAAALRSLLTREVLGPVAHALERPEADLRATLVASQMVGLAMARYVLGFEPLASADGDALVAAVGPTLQRYLTGDIAP